MSGTWEVWNARKIRALETKIEQKRYSVLQVKCFQLLTDRTQSYIVWSASMKSATYDIKKKTQQKMQVEVLPKGNIFSK